VIAFRDTGETERLTALLEQAQRLGRAGVWEENFITGQVHWTAATCSLFGLPPGAPVHLADLHQRVPAEDMPAVQAFRDRLTRQQDAATAAFRIIRADDSSVRQLRALAQPVTGPGGEPIAVRRAYQDASDRYHTPVAFAITQEQLADTEERAREEHRLALRLQQAITGPQSTSSAATGMTRCCCRTRACCSRSGMSPGTESAPSPA
jgi:PAS domain-containing protein